MPLRLTRAGLLLVVISAVFALTAVSAGAAAKKLKLARGEPTETPFAASIPYWVVNNEDITFEMFGGVLTCSAGSNYPFYQGFQGKLTTNSEKTDAVELEKPYGPITGEFCASTVPLPTPAYVALHSEANPAGSLSLKTNGKAQITTSSGNPMLVYIDFNFGQVECSYEATKLKGKWTAGPFEFLERVVKVQFEKQKFKLVKTGSSAQCPKKAYMNAPFEYSLGEEVGELWFVKATLG
jgi:hypothetical protein